MKELDKKDLHRFAWKKLSPGIEKKIKEKKKKRFFFRMSAFGGLMLMLTILGFWYGIDYIKTPSQFSVVQNLKSIKTKRTKNRAPIVNAPKNKTTENSLTLIKHSSNLTDTKVAKNSATNHPSSIHSQAVQNKQFNDVKNKKRLSSLSLKLTEINFSSPKYDTALENNFNKEETPAIATDQYYENISRLPLLVLDSLAAVEHRDQLENPLVKMIEMKEEAKSSIELAFDLNRLDRHPYAAQIGYGFSLGYNAAINHHHYVGFEFGFQRLKYRFNYPEVVLVPTTKTASDNIHDIYSIPLYYGYRFCGYRTTLSLETGVNLALIKFSTGEISSPTNSAYILKTVDGEYFSEKFGTSLLFRTKIDFLLKNDVGLFARLGANIALRNWYRDDSFKIKPIILNLDLGIKKSF